MLSMLHNKHSCMRTGWECLVCEVRIDMQHGNPTAVVANQGEVWWPAPTAGKRDAGDVVHAVGDPAGSEVQVVGEAWLASKEKGWWWWVGGDVRGWCCLYEGFQDVEAFLDGCQCVCAGLLQGACWLISDRGCPAAENQYNQYAGR